MKNRQRIFIKSLSPSWSWQCLAVALRWRLKRSGSDLLPPSPAYTRQGDLSGKAIKLALEEINAAGGVNGKKIDLRIIDSQSSNPGALAALQKAVEQEKVLALIGCLYSTQVFATSDAIKNYGIPTFIGATNVNLTKQGNPWLFRVRPDDSVAAGAMVKYIKEDTKFTKDRTPARYGCLWHRRRRLGRKVCQGGGADRGQAGEVRDRG